MADSDIDDGEKIAKAEALLPAWFIPRMMTDAWHFGLVMSNGYVLAIECINDVRQAPNGAIWLDVQLSNSESQIEEKPDPLAGRYIKHPPTRGTASVNAAHIAFAMELSHT